MLKFNHKYQLIFLSLLTFVFAGEDIYVEKDSDGIYEVTFEKIFHDVSDQLELTIDEYQGNIIINGHSQNRIKIFENCKIKTYSEKDAKLKYYQAKVGFILNEDRFEISENRKSQKCESTIILDIPDYTVINIEAKNSEVMISRMDGDIHLKCRDSELTLDQISSKIDVESKTSDISIISCSLVGDLIASRGRLMISSLKSEYFNATLYGADLDAERIDSKVTFKSTGGNIFIDESHNDAKLYTAGGDISVDEIYGNLACDAKGGTIDIGEVDGICVMECVSGDISIEEVYGDLKIDAINTDVEVESAHSSVYIETTQKDIEVTKHLNEEDNNTVLIKNKGGDIELYLDAGINASVAAKIEYTDGDSDDWTIESDFQLENTRSEKRGKQGYISKKGTINKGGSTVILKNKNGDIYIYQN